MIEAGAKAPDFTLPDHTGHEVSLSGFARRRLLIAFYPLDFSPLCSEQMILYQGISRELDEAGVRLIGISVDSAFAHKAFRETLGFDTQLLADFEPKGAVASAYGAYLEQAGHSNRSLVLIDGEGTVEWSYASDAPIDIPPTQLILDAIG